MVRQVAKKLASLFCDEKIDVICVRWHLSKAKGASGGKKASTVWNRECMACWENNRRFCSDGAFVRSLKQFYVGVD